MERQLHRQQHRQSGLSDAAGVDMAVLLPLPVPPGAEVPS